jgi:hypothetical protein
MNKSQLKVVGILCLVICLICLFVAVERYRTNAENVRIIRTQGWGPIPEMVRWESREGIPVATQYAVFFALLSGIGGGVLLLKSEP